MLVSVARAAAINARIYNLSLDPSLSVEAPAEEFILSWSAAARRPGAVPPGEGEGKIS